MRDYSLLIKFQRLRMCFLSTLASLSFLGSVSSWISVAVELALPMLNFDGAAFSLNDLVFLGPSNSTLILLPLAVKIGLMFSLF